MACNSFNFVCFRSPKLWSAMSYLCDRLLDDKAFEQIVLAESLKERDKLDVSKNYITCSGIKFMCHN